jgi:hypothetical protein
MFNPCFRFIFLLYFFSSTLFAGICENIQTNLSSLSSSKDQQIQGVQGMVLVNSDLYFLLNIGETFTETKTSLMRLNVDNDKGVEWVPDLLSSFEQLPSKKIQGVSLIPQGTLAGQTVLLPLYAENNSSNISIQGLQAGDVIFLLDIEAEGFQRQALSIYRNQGSRFQWLHSAWDTEQSTIQVTSRKTGQWAVLAEKTPHLDALGMTLMPSATGSQLLNTTAFSPINENNVSKVAYNLYHSESVDTQSLADVQPWLEYQDDKITALTLSTNAKTILIAGRSETESTHQGEVRVHCISPMDKAKNRKSTPHRLGDGTQVAFLVNDTKTVEGITSISGGHNKLTDSEGKFYYKLGLEPSFYIGNQQTGIFLGQGKPQQDPKNEHRKIISLATLVAPENKETTKLINMERLLRVLDKNKDLDNGIIIEQETLDIINQQGLSDKINFDLPLDVFAKADDVNSLLDNLTPHFNERRQIIAPKVVIVSSGGGGTPSPYIETRKQALRLLRQSAFVSKEEDIEFIRLFGDKAWIKKQLALPSDLDEPIPVDPLDPIDPLKPVEPVEKKYGYLDSLLQLLNQANPSRYAKDIISDPYNNLEEYEDKDRFKFLTQSVWWQKALHNEDQLRQRVAYALSQLLVISDSSPAGAALNHRGESIATYYDILLKHSLGNYRTLLKEVSLSSAMSYYLTYVGNKKADGKSAPDENYARELMQLFTIGLYELNLDGTQKLSDDKSLPIPAYTQEDVSQLARVFTGWDWQDRDATAKYGSTSYRDHSLTVPIEFNAAYHDFGQKKVLGKTIASGLQAGKDIDAALDILFSNPNIAPHVSKHLIMRLVTSNPTPAYVERIATVFNDNGEGVKGDLKATVEAILTDPEARDPASRIKALQELAAKNPDPLKSEINDNFGKVDEFLLATTHFLSAFNVRPLPVWTYWNPNPLSKRVQLLNSYWFTPKAYYPQVPLQAESVFNFYSPEFVPSDEYFVNNKLVAPELQIRNNNGLLGFSGLIYSLLDYEKYHLIDLGSHNKASASDMTAWATNNKKDRFDTNNLYLDLTALYNLFEQQLDGDTNGDFTNMANSTRKAAAINGLINYLNEHLLGSTLPADYRTQLSTHLLTITSKDLKENAYFIVSTAIRAIVSSPLYMVLD